MTPNDLIEWEEAADILKVKARSRKYRKAKVGELLTSYYSKVGAWAGAMFSKSEANKVFRESTVTSKPIRRAA